MQLAAHSQKGCHVGICTYALQCCEPSCLKWRRLPAGHSAADPKFEEDWYCSMNPNKKLAAAGHDYPQEPDEVALKEYVRAWLKMGSASRQYVCMRPLIQALAFDLLQDAEEEKREQEQAQARRRAQEFMKRKKEQSSNSAAAKRRYPSTRYLRKRTWHDKGDEPAARDVVQPAKGHL